MACHINHYMILTNLYNRKLYPVAILCLIYSDVVAGLNTCQIEVNLSCFKCNTG